MSNFTEEDIKNISTNSSYIRGVSYYENGRILSKEYHKNKLTAQVQGSRVYQVTIVNKTDSYGFSCTCPYDFGGICKHCVAVGLDLIHSEHNLEEKTDKNEGTSEKTSYLKVKELLGMASREEQEEFLKRLLKESESTKNRFETFIKGQLAIEEDLDITDIREQIVDTVLKIDLENVNRFYEAHNSRYYKEQWRILYDEGREELSDKLDFILANIEKYLEQDDIIDGWKFLLAGYEAARTEKINSVEDPYEIFYEGLGIEILDIINEEYINQIERYIDKNPPDKKVKLRMLEVMGNRLSQKQDEIKYNLKFFQPILLSLITKSSTATFFKNILAETKEKCKNIAEIYLKITELTDSAEKWEEYALNNYQNNPEISKKLLNFYQKNKNTEKYKDIAKNIFNNFPNRFDEPIFNYLKDKGNTSFLKKVLQHYLSRTRNISLYRELKNRFGEQEAENYIKQRRDKRIESQFYIRLLKEEEQYNKILEYLKENIDNRRIDYIVKPIIDIYPEECVTLLKNKISQYLESNTGRKIYKQAIQWINLLKNISDKKLEKKIDNYIENLLDTYTRRPAFQDEMKKAGFQ